MRYLILYTFIRGQKMWRSVRDLLPSEHAQSTLRYILYTSEAWKNSFWGLVVSVSPDSSLDKKTRYACPNEASWCPLQGRGCWGWLGWWRHGSTGLRGEGLLCCCLSLSCLPLGIPLSWPFHAGLPSSLVILETLLGSGTNLLSTGWPHASEVSGTAHTDAPVSFMCWGAKHSPDFQLCRWFWKSYLECVERPSDLFGQPFSSLP